MTSSVFHTSLFRDAIRLRIVGDSLSIEALPPECYGHPMVAVISIGLSRRVKQISFKANYPLLVHLPDLAEGEYSLDFYWDLHVLSNCMQILNQHGTIILSNKDNSWAFLISPVFSGNKVKFVGQSSDYLAQIALCQASHDIQSDDCNITELANRIVKNKAGNYEKVLALHDWVAGNIYYDYDSLVDESYKTNPSDAISVLRSRRTVCQGFASLLVALIRSIGVPAKLFPCFALGESASVGGWENPDNLNNKHNHVIAEAFIDGRWVIIDPTWDSNNEFRNGEYRISYNNRSVPRTFFDCTLAFISITHRF